MASVFLLLQREDAVSNARPVTIGLVGILPALSSSVSQSIDPFGVSNRLVIDGPNYSLKHCSKSLVQKRSDRPELAWLITHHSPPHCFSPAAAEGWTHHLRA